MNEITLNGVVYVRKEINMPNPMCEECDIEMHPFAFDGAEGFACGGCGWSFDTSEEDASMPFTESIPAIQEARRQLAEDNRQARIMQKLTVEAFIENASLQECLHVINQLTERVSTLTGCANHLEDAACDLIEEIEVQR